MVPNVVPHGFSKMFILILKTLEQSCMFNKGLDGKTKGVDRNGRVTSEFALLE